MFKHPREFTLLVLMIFFEAYGSFPMSRLFYTRKLSIRIDGFSFSASENLELAVDTKMAKNEEMQLFFIGVGLCCKLDEGCKLRLKFDKNLQFGSSLQFKIHDEASLTMAFNIDTTNLSAGQHKIGLGIDIGS